MPFRCTKDTKHESTRADTCTICGAKMCKVDGGPSLDFTLAMAHPVEKPCMNCGAELDVNVQTCPSCGCEYLSAVTYIENAEPATDESSRILGSVSSETKESVLSALLNVDLSTREGRPAGLTPPPPSFHAPIRLQEPVLTFGSGDTAIVIPDDGVDPAHGKFIRQDDGSYCLQDLGSATGTYLNGVKLRPGEARKLKPNDVITVGYWHTIRIQL